MWQPCGVLKELRGNRGGVSKQILIKAARHSGHKAFVFLWIYSPFLFPSCTNTLFYICMSSHLSYVNHPKKQTNPKLFFLSCHRYEQGFYYEGLLIFPSPLHIHTVLTQIQYSESDCQPSSNFSQSHEIRFLQKPLSGGSFKALLDRPSVNGSKHTDDRRASAP